MTTDITELAQRMKAAAEKATPGEWWADDVKKRRMLRSGDDCVEGFTPYAIYGSDGQTSSIHSTVTPHASVRNTTARGMWHGMRRRSVMPNSSLWLTLPTFSRW